MWRLVNMVEKEVHKILQISRLCDHMNEEQVKALVHKSITNCVHYNKNDIIFRTEEPMTKLHVLVKGNIAIAKDTISGKRILGKSIVRPGELVGEIYLFSSKNTYWTYAVALQSSTVLEISSELLFQTKAVDIGIQNIILRNILHTVVDKVNYISEKVKIISEDSVRKKIINYFFDKLDVNQKIVIDVTREEMADYLNVARPSLSRELSRLQKEGIIALEGKEVHIVNQELFDEFL